MNMLVNPSVCKWTLLEGVVSFSDSVLCDHSLRGNHALRNYELMPNYCHFQCSIHVKILCKIVLCLFSILKSFFIIKAKSIMVEYFESLEVHAIEMSSWTESYNFVNSITDYKNALEEWFA